MLVPEPELESVSQAWGVEQTLTYREYPAPLGQGWGDGLFGQIRLGLRFGFESGVPWAQAQSLLAAGGQSLDLLENIRMLKSDWEVAQIERAARYADWGVGEVLRRAWQGCSAAETLIPMQSLQQKIMRELPDWDPLSTKVQAAAWPAPLSAQPCGAPPLGARLGQGPHVALVLTRVNGYAAECARTFFTSRPDAHERELFGLMGEARKIAYSMLRPGVACGEIDAAVNRFFGAGGHADHRTRLHRCGHGFGLGHHEPPWLAQGSGHVLVQGMVISIEPGIQAPGSGGYRHSDTVLITEDGYRMLTHAACGLESLVLPAASMRQRISGWLVRRSLNLVSESVPEAAASHGMCKKVDALQV